MSAKCDSRPWGKNEGMPWGCCLECNHEDGHCWHADWGIDNLFPHHWLSNGESILMEPHERAKV